jgi:hypothetical protein
MCLAKWEITGPSAFAVLIVTKVSQEAEIATYIHANVTEIATGKEGACPHCQGTVYISCYGDDVPKLR